MSHCELRSHMTPWTSLSRGHIAAVSALNIMENSVGHMINQTTIDYNLAASLWLWTMKTNLPDDKSMNINDAMDKILKGNFTHSSRNFQEQVCLSTQVTWLCSDSSKTMALYKSFSYLLTYLLTYWSSPRSEASGWLQSAITKMDVMSQAPSLQHTYYVAMRFQFFIVECGIAPFLCAMCVLDIRASSPRLPLCQILFLSRPPLMS